MQIRFPQLKNHLDRSSIPVLLVSGDEPYQHMQASDMFRARARKLGFTERKAFFAEPEFDWNELAFAKDNLSLFSERVLIDLRLPTSKIGTEGSKAIVNFTDHLHQDVMLLIQAPRMDRSTLNAAWAKAVDKVGGILRVWPTSERETRNLIGQALSSRGFSFTDDIVALIAQQAEGNLLAAMQEVEKIALIDQAKELDLHAIEAALTNSSRYSLNELTDAVKKRDVSRVIRVWYGLKREGVAPPLLLWGLTEQVRQMTETGNTPPGNRRSERRDGLARQTFMHQQSIGVRSAGRRPGPRDLLKQCAWVDRVIKGRAGGDPWHELLQLGIAATGAA